MADKDKQVQKVKVTVSKPTLGEIVVNQDKSEAK